MFMPSQYLYAHLLLILPDEDERRTVAARLTRVGYRVSIATCGMQGRQLAALDRPSLIVADVAQPDMDGFTCCGLLKTDVETREIALILIGADCTARERIAGLTLGAVDFLSKPYDVDELSTRVRVHLGLMPRHAAAAVDGGNGSAPARASLDDITVTAALRLIDNRLDDPPNVAEIARAAGTYRERLTLLFRERFGCSVADYARERRFERAVQLLRDTDLGIGEVARLVGYPTARNFSTAFRERTGMAPAEWRRRLPATPDSLDT